VVQAAERNGEFVADLAPEGELLGEAHVVRLGGAQMRRDREATYSDDPSPEGTAENALCRWLSPSGDLWCMMGADLLANFVNSFWCHVSPPFQVVFCDRRPPSREQRWIR
jgi:hypothetical protein